MKVTRKVDTVVVEMDIDLAEKVLEILRQVNDHTSTYGSEVGELRMALLTEADVRAPSPLYIADIYAGNLQLRRTTGGEMDNRAAASRG